MILSEKKEQIVKTGTSISFLDNESHFEDCILERLNKPNAKVFEYLLNSHERANISSQKSWNSTPKNSKFIELSKNMIKNYLALAIHSEEIFEGADLSISSPFS